MRIPLALLSLVLACSLASATDLSKVDRTITKEPVYKSKTPKYGLLLFGPEAKDRVWMVLDGDVLYVDRNGNGDLTEAGEVIAAKETKWDPKEYGYTFEVGDLHVGGKIHKGLTVSFPPLARYGDNSNFADYVHLKKLLKADPKAVGVSLAVDVESSRLKGGGVGGRLSTQAGWLDDNGILQFAGRPQDAPVIHLDGPIYVTFYGWRPTLRLERENDLVLMVGTPGRGPGTFAMLAYEDTVPQKVYPQVDITFPGSRKEEPPVQEHYELKQRC